MTKKNILMTGATSGFGVVIAEFLVKSPCNLIIFARSEEKSESLKQGLSKHLHPETNVQFVKCDLKSLKSVNAACDKVLEQFQQLDILIQNAGIMSFKFAETEDGIEETLQVNLLAPMLITKKLKHLVPNDGTAKILYTVSALHQGSIQFDDIEFRNKFSSFRSYRNSKLGLILMTRLQASREEFKNISVVSIHPGMIKTELGRKAGWFARLIFKLLGSSVEKGAETHIHLLNADSADIVTGEYYAGSKVKKITSESYDMEMAKRLEEVIESYIEPFVSS